MCPLIAPCLLHREISRPGGGSARSLQGDFAGHGARLHRRRHLRVGVHGESRFGFADGYAAGLLQAHARDRDLRSHGTTFGTKARDSWDDFELLRCAEVATRLQHRDDAVVAPAATVAVMNASVLATNVPAPVPNFTPVALENPCPRTPTESPTLPE